jgi:hypothetical protein
MRASSSVIGFSKHPPPVTVKVAVEDEDVTGRFTAASGGGDRRSAAPSAGHLELVAMGCAATSAVMAGSAAWNGIPWIGLRLV